MSFQTHRIRVPEGPGVCARLEDEAGLARDRLKATALQSRSAAVLLRMTERRRPTLPWRSGGGLLGRRIPIRAPHRDVYR